MRQKKPRIVGATWTEKWAILLHGFALCAEPPDTAWQAFFYAVILYLCAFVWYLLRTIGN